MIKTLCQTLKARDAQLEREHFTGVVWDSLCYQYQAWRRGVCVGWNTDKAKAWGLIEEGR